MSYLEGGPRGDLFSTLQQQRRDIAEIYSPTEQEISYMEKLLKGFHDSVLRQFQIKPQLFLANMKGTRKDLEQHNRENTF